jgi:hypothetical protein
MKIRVLFVSLAAAGVLLAAGPARAQLGSVSVAKNAGNNPDQIQDETFVSFQRKSTVGTTSVTPTQVKVRYAAAVGTDTGFGSSNTSISLASDYTLSFNATAPGNYQLQVTTSVNGAFTIVDDFGGPSATASMTAVNGTQTGGSLAGSLSLSAPGTLNSDSTANTPFNRTSSATISGTSNGVAKPHTLRFTWSQSCFSNGGIFSNGDECAVRLGLPLDYGGETAGDYPGTGGRNAALDGHFVTVTLISLCGNGTLDGGEQCDEAAGNGSPNSCCTATCQFRSAGQQCRGAAGACDIAETCSGSSGACPADAKSTSVCRPAAGACDVAESCNGISVNCPADAFSSPLVTCRASAGACDIAENCTGTGPLCPVDAKSTAVCRPSAGDCDLADSCNGVANTCPPDQLVTAGTTCRPAASDCDVAETCTGSSVACPADGFQPDGSPCTDNDACTLDSCEGGACVSVDNLDACTDDFLCYKGKTSQPTPLPGVSLADEFESGNFIIRKGKFLCNPANKNNEGIIDPLTHLRGYLIKAATGAPAHVRQTNLLVTNQIGQIRVDTIKPDVLLVPAGKDLGSQPPAPDPQNHNVDHYKCYKVKVTPGTPKFVRTQVTVEDQFETPAKTYDLRKVKHLCLPVDKNGEGIKNADANLLCYLTKPSLGQPKHVKRLGVYVTTQFGPERVDTVKEAELCIPSERPAPGSPSGAFLAGDATLP